jgi:hypothetical protein
MIVHSVGVYLVYLVILDQDDAFIMVVNLPVDLTTNAPVFPRLL